MRDEGALANNVVRCICNGIEASGTYAVEGDGRFLVLTTPFGVTRAPLGLMQPRKMAARLLKNLCSKATASGETTLCCDAAQSQVPPAETG